jgi:hypothetical protein
MAAPEKPVIAHSASVVVWLRPCQLTAKSQKAKLLIPVGLAISSLHHRAFNVLKTTSLQIVNFTKFL